MCTAKRLMSTDNWQMSTYQRLMSTDSGSMSADKSPVLANGTLPQLPSHQRIRQFRIRYVAFVGLPYPQPPARARLMRLIHPPLPPRQHPLPRPLSSRRIRPNANVTWNTSCQGNGSRTMSLRAKLIAVFALFGVIPVVALGVFTYVRSMQAVEDLVAT